MAPPPPSKIIAVHLNYESRAAQRGRVPDVALVLPQAALLAGRRRRSDRAPAGHRAAHVRGRGRGHHRPRGARRHARAGRSRTSAGTRPRTTSACYDLRWNDRGSNVLVEGPGRLHADRPAVAAADVDPGAITLAHARQRRARAGRHDGEPALPVRAAGRRPLALHDARARRRHPHRHARGLAARRAGRRRRGRARRAARRSRNPIVEAPAPIPPFGAQPRVSPADARRRARRQRAARGDAHAGAEAALRSVSTATLTVQIAKRGVRNTFVKGLRPTRPDLRLLGYAHTLRYVPLREDVRDADTAELNAQKSAIEAIGPGEVLVIDARGEPGAGTIGDILAARALARGATGIVTDGGAARQPGARGARDPDLLPGAARGRARARALPARVERADRLRRHRSSCPATSIVGDAEGVVVVPAAMAEEVALGALEQEEREAWALERVQAGESIRGVYPLAASARPSSRPGAPRARDSRRHVRAGAPPSRPGSSRPCAACARARRPRSRSRARPSRSGRAARACSVTDAAPR